jgi:ribosomal protein L11 methyltransferase
VLCGSKEVIPNKQYNAILANINRNILLDQIDRYHECLTGGGELYLSGFFQEDLTILSETASTLNLSYVKHKILDNWCAVKFLKQT